MRSAATDALNLLREIRSHILDAPAILADEKDANYFRSFLTNHPDPPTPPKTRQPIQLSSPTPPTPPPFNEQPETQTICSSAEKHLPPPPGALKSLFAKIAPELPILEKIPSDAFAKKMATRWKTKNKTAPITLLTLSEPPQQKALLYEIAKAIDVYFAPTKVVSAEPIEKNQQWDAFLTSAELKLIVACDYTLWQLNALMPFYRENASSGARTLKQIPLFLLPDLSLYLKDPLLKRSLWKALCQKLTT